MPFFGPNSLSGAMPSDASGGLDPQLLQSLLAQFPGLEGMRQAPQQQSPSALQGYQWPGITFVPGQGTPQSLGNLSPFEGAKGFGSESITAGLALGNYGKSSSQQSPMSGQAAQPFSLGQLSLPTLSLPQMVAAQQGGYGDGLGEAGATGEGAEGAGGISLNLGDAIGTAQEGLSAFGTPNLGTQTTTPGFAEQRAGERDYSNVTGSPSGIPQLPPLNISGPGGIGPSAFQGGPSPSAIFGGGSESLPLLGAPGTGGIDTGGLNPGAGSIFSEGASPTMSAPGGSAQHALGDAGTG